MQTTIPHIEAMTMNRLARRSQHLKPVLQRFKKEALPALRALAPIAALPALARRRPPRSAASIALAAAALGALAFGALAIGALAVGRLTIRKARVKSLEVDELTVRTLRIHKTGAVDLARAAEAAPSRESTVGA